MNQEEIDKLFEAMKKASVDELNMVKGIDKNLAISIYNYLQKF